jgi:hypothetical protein
VTTAHSIDPLKVRRALGRDQWKPPVPYGPDGFIIENRDSHRLIVTVADVDGTDWIHCSLHDAEPYTALRRANGDASSRHERAMGLSGFRSAGRACEHP